MARTPATQPSPEELDRLVLYEYPYPIAVNYRKLLETLDAHNRTQKCFEVFEYTLRTVTLSLLTQYLGQHVLDLNDPILDQQLSEKLQRASLGQWLSFLFLGLRAYEGRRELCFSPELYDLYWDTARTPHREHRNLQAAFVELVKARNEVAHGFPPETDAGWELFLAPVMGHLRTVLAHFAFLQHYDLIRVVAWHDGIMEYERYTGQEVSTREQSWPEEKPLRIGWFYLRRADGEMLALHPLLIFWTGEEEGGRAGAAGQADRDAAVFGKLEDEVVEYLATVVRKPVRRRDRDLVEQIRQLVAGPARGKQRKRPALSWTELKQAAEEVSAQEMGSMQEKYDSNLYLQRDETYHKLRDFLASERGCFVLTGKSGVGKTNFVLALAEELGNREDVCLVAYNAARESVAGGDLLLSMTRQFAEYVDLKAGGRLALFDAIHGLGMSGRLFVVVFDAINENTDGRQVLRTIDDLLHTVRQPWLKVIITSRPEAWRTLKRGLPLAEDRYYREPGSDEYAIELKEFAVQMDQFQREELPAAYAKYQAKYRLQTPYAALKAPIKETLRDPLFLRLVAQTYHDRSIPDELQVSGIYAQYEQMLQDTERLEKRDLRFLEHDLMPLMLAEGHYENKVSATQVNSASTASGRPLWDLIHNEDPMGDGRPVNQSYARLVDCEILTGQGAHGKQEVRFKYERFYDYHGGVRLRSLLESKSLVEERAAAYRELILLIQSKPYLWGVVYSAVLEDVKAGRSDLLVALAQTIDQPTKELIVAVLTAYGKDRLQEARALCHQLLALGEAPQQKGGLDLVKQLIGRRRATRKPAAQASAEDAVDRLLEAQEATGIHMAKKAAIEVAYNLSFEDVLLAAACDASSATRAVAIQYTYYLWRHDAEAGFRIMEQLSQRIIARGLIPNTQALESCLGISLMILFWHYKDLDRRQAYFRRLQMIWRPPIERVLFLQESDPAIVASAKMTVRQTILRLFTRLATGLARSGEEGLNMFGIEDLATLFPANATRRRLMETFVQHVDAMHGGCPGIETIERELIEVMAERSLLVTYVPFLAIVSYSLIEPDATLGMLKKLFEIALNDPPPPAFPGASPAAPMIQVMVWGVRNLMYGNRFAGVGEASALVTAERVDTMADFIRRFEDRYSSRCSTELREYRLNEIGTYTYFHYVLNGEAHSDLLTYLLNKAVAEQDTDAMIRYAAGLSGLGSHPAYGIPRPALQVLHQVYLKWREMKLNPDQNRRIRSVLVACFANVRAYHADVVDDFLAGCTDNEFAPDMKQAIQARGATESMGMLLGTAAAWFARDFLVDPDPYMRNLLKWLFMHATRARNFEDWVRPLVSRLINIAYGKPVFRVRA